MRPGPDININIDDILRTEPKHRVQSHMGFHASVDNPYPNSKKVYELKYMRQIDVL